jgi:hypothetical protein
MIVAAQNFVVNAACAAYVLARYVYERVRRRRD